MFDPFQRLRRREAVLRSINAHLGEDYLDKWISAVPDTFAGLCERWAVDPTGLPGSGAASVVVFGRRETDRRDVVVKLIADPAAYSREVAIMHGLADAGAAPELLARDDAAHALLYDRILPGTPGHGVAVRDAVRAAGHVWDGPVAGGMSAEEALRPRVAWLRQSHPGSEVYEDVARTADAVLDHLTATRGSAPAYQMHGDLQAKNFVVDHAGTAWLIDPRPTVGERETDIALWIATQGSDVEPNIAEAARLVDGLDADRLREWVVFFCLAETREAGRRLLASMPDVAGLPVDRERLAAAAAHEGRA